MGRIVVTVLVVAAIAAGIFYYNWTVENAIHDDDQKQIVELQKQAAALKDQNIALKAQSDQARSDLAKVQSEQANLEAQNEALNKAIATYKSTGKMPELALPYPPK